MVSKTVEPSGEISGLLTPVYDPKRADAEMSNRAVSRLRPAAAVSSSRRPDRCAAALSGREWSIQSKASLEFPAQDR